MNLELTLGKAASVIFLALAMAGCGGGAGTTTTPETEPPPPDPAIAEREAIKTAIGMAETAVAAVDNDSTDAEVSAADAAVASARSAITAATGVPAQERAANTATVDVLANRLTAAKTARTTAMNEADKAAEIARAATAAKLYDGISSPSADRASGYGTGANADDILVEIDGAGTFLFEDNTATIADHHGWEGKRYTRTTTGGNVFEAVVYSNVGEPTEGDKFSRQYFTGINEDGVLDEDITESAARFVASPSFDQSAGTKEFELPENTLAVKVSGSYRGVAGTYSCVPGAGNTCAARLAESGFDLGGVDAANAFAADKAAWTFKPTDPDARLMDVPDADYASYGWWIRKAPNDGDFTASALATTKGTVPAASGITALRGTATYTGGAAGKYALSSSTGGTNDAGHFTADARLEANFNDDTITGAIDNFMGADGEARDWSVELKRAAISDTGTITRADANDTVWSIGGTASSASGEWVGGVVDNGDDGVPKVAVGWFYSEYGTAGKMVGAFGANRQ